MDHDIRLANLDDLSFLLDLEKAFPPERRFSQETLKRSILSHHQNVFIINYAGKRAGSATIWKHKFSWRLFNIVVFPEFRKNDLGRILLNYIIQLAKTTGIDRMILEVDFKEKSLIKWYETFGFGHKEKLENYYGENLHGYRMSLVFKKDSKEKRYYTNLLVVEENYPWLTQLKNVQIVKADEFINNDTYRKSQEVRVFNFCSNYDFQSIGYYVSLLAVARGLKAIPNMVTIEDFNEEVINKSIGEEFGDLIHKTLKHRREKIFIMKTMFGKTYPKQYTELGKRLNRFFDSPATQFVFKKDRNWNLVSVNPILIKDLEIDEDLITDLNKYFQEKRFYKGIIKQYKYDLAILVDPKEKAPPSGKTALARMVESAERKGFYTELITKEDYHRLPQFDALFIRATTDVNNYTYQFSRFAIAEGLIVIDDPWSILKCANKIYFHEAMKQENVPTPKTIIISKKTTLETVMNTIPFPIILKRPDSSSSQGVFKVSNEKELKNKLQELFKTGELLVAQEYLKTDFDWRIGILGNKAIYACKYYMARDHWQIFNWQAKGGRVTVGGSDTFLVEDAPEDVVKYALKAASLMGDGFYGVDVKYVNNRPYVIEVNDCPSIDHGWEDKILGDALYDLVADYFIDKIEQSRNKNPRVETKKKKDSR